jgi:hypothetical protein
VTSRSRTSRFRRTGRGATDECRLEPRRRSARGWSQEDGQKLIETYQNLGLLLDLADHAVEAGLLEVWTVLSVPPAAMA